MKLIIGGAYQGKLAYAKEQYQVWDGWIDGCFCGAEELLSCRGIFHFHEYIRRMLTEEAFARQAAGGGAPFFSGENLISLEEDAARFADLLEQHNRRIVIVSTELGYGIVPAVPSDRLWREAAGRICTCIAGRAEEVTRVVCGIGVRLK